MSVELEYLGQKPAKEFDTYTQEITKNIEIPAGKNAFAVGPVTVASGVEIVVPTNSVFVVI
jgi:hypothetical protein